MVLWDLIRQKIEALTLNQKPDGAIAVGGVRGVWQDAESIYTGRGAPKAVEEGFSAFIQGYPERQ